VLGRLVDEREGISIAGDLLFRAVARLGVLEDDGFETWPRGSDSLETVRRLARLDDGHLPERVEDLRRLLGEELLFALVLTDLLNRRGILAGKLDSAQKVGLEGVNGVLLGE
jgi:hypothetical protein